MQVSARILGKEYGLTAEEMNKVLLKLGFLKGTPGDYSLTEKALKLAKETDFHRGTGGYAHYNQYWTTRTFDDSIKKYLNVTPELVQEVRTEIAASRAAKRAAQAAARAAADADFLAKQAAKNAAKAAEECAAENAEKFTKACKKAGITGLIIGGGTVIAYGTYKAVPRIKSWIRGKKQSEQQEKTRDEEEVHPEDI